MHLEVDRRVRSRLNESRGSVCTGRRTVEAQLFGMEVKEMLGEKVCALGIPEEDMRAAEDREDEVGAREC